MSAADLGCGGAQVSGGAGVVAEKLIVGPIELE